MINAPRAPCSRGVRCLDSSRRRFCYGALAAGTIVDGILHDGIIYPPTPAMSIPSRPDAAAALGREWDHLAARERRIMEAVLHRRPVARDMSQVLTDDRSFGQRMADRIAAFGGSWPFI